MLVPALVIGTASYLYDVVALPNSIAKQARRYADSLGKPLLNIGAGTRQSSVRVAVFGPTLWGDVNMDLAATSRVCGPEVVCFGDAAHIPYPDKYFGACIASHVLEHVDNPVAVVRELKRVSNRVYAVVPKWWAPHTWMHPGHKWFISQTGKTFSLWR